MCPSSEGVSYVTIMRNCVAGCFWNVHNHNSSLQDGWSSLMEACWNGHAEVVKILVSAGAHVNDKDQVRSTSPA